MMGTLSKFSSKSIAEISERGKQAVSAWAERTGISPAARLLSDRELLEHLDLGPEKVRSPDDLLSFYRSRKLPRFYASFDDRAETAAVFKGKFGNELTKLLSKADRVCEGHFDLLGYRQLFFGKIPDWHLDPISSLREDEVHWSRFPSEESSPAPSRKVIWELNRHQYFSLLGRAYWLSGDEKYAAAFATHLSDWFVKNPPKMGINWSSSLEVAFRTISWTWAFYFFKDSPHFTPGLLTDLLRFLDVNGRHLETYLSTFYSPNTHLTGEALGLYFIGTFFPELRLSKRWKDRGYDILIRALEFQVREDGGYCEQSTHYHRYTSDFYLNLMILRELEGKPIDPVHRANLERLLNFLLSIQEPNGHTPLVGDDDGGRLYFLDDEPTDNFKPTLALAATLLKSGELKSSTAAGEELLWLLGPSGLREFEAIEPITPNTLSRAFPDSGFFVMRTSWDEDASYALIDCGDHGFLNGGHAHADALGLVLSLRGRPLFIDSGTYAYASDILERNALRSSPAHNCLTVNGQSSSIVGGTFSWQAVAHAQLLEWGEFERSTRFRGTHDGFQRFGVVYRRQVELSEDGSLELRDEIASANINSFELNFILDPKIEPSMVEDGVEMASAEGNAHLFLMNSVVESPENVIPGRWSITDCDVSFRFGSKVRTNKLSYKMRAVGDFCICTRITPVAGR